MSNMALLDELVCQICQGCLISIGCDLSLYDGRDVFGRATSCGESLHT
jgi:hypothetical protein